MADLKISQLTASTTPLAGTEVLPIVQSGSTKQVSVANLTTGRAVTVKSLNAATGLSGATQATDITISRTSSTGAVLTGPNIYLDDGTANNTIAIQNGAGYLQVFGYNGSFVELLAMNNTGNLSLKTGNLVIGTSGKGIDFSATPGTGTSELLADYEEGTWTPALTGPASQTYTSTGYYVKVGSTVLIQGIITWTGAPSGGSNYRVALPFGSTTNKPENLNFVMVGLSTAAAAIKYFDVYQNSSNAYFRDTSGTAYNYAGLIGTGSLAFSGVYSTT